MSRKALRWTVLAAVVAVGIAAASEPARAQAGGEAKLRSMNRTAMDAYDLLEYEQAKRTLSDAIIYAKQNGLGDTEAAARTHLNLGIVLFSGVQDRDAAEVEFVNALEIAPAIELPPAYKTDEMAQKFSALKADFGAPPDTGGSAATSGGGQDCGSVEGVEHNLIDATTAGQARDVKALVAGGVGASRVVLYYRNQGSAEFTGIDMNKVGSCVHQATIPASSVQGEYIYYYIAAEDGGGESVASSGSSGTPNIMEVTTGAVGGGGEDPLGGGDAGVTKGTSSASDKTLFISMALGSGGGYVTGKTEVRSNQVACCFAPSIMHVFPELGFYLNPQTSLSAAFRLGFPAFPVGANVVGHATAAPAGLARLRYTVSESGEGVLTSFAVGGGVMRNAVPLAEVQPSGGDTDTAVSGPLLAGAGLGYLWSVSDLVDVVTEVNALAGIPVVDQLGNCAGGNTGCVEPNFGLQIDANLALLLSF